MKNPQIALVEQWFQSINKSLDREDKALNDMEIIQFQALLMDNGANLFHAFKQGDMAVILAGLVNLAYSAASAAVVAGVGEQMPTVSVSWQHDGLMVSIMRSLSHHIDACSSGQVKDYAALHTLCKCLAKDFLNADFDKAFQRVYQMHLENRHVPITQAVNMPDLSDCLFE
jgi:hypothetical protein